MTTQRLIFTAPERREDDLVAALWELGTLGVQVLEGAGGEVRVEAYFDEPVPDGAAEEPSSVPGVELVGWEEVPVEDWLAPYRELARPLPVGERLLLDPRDPDDGAEAGAVGGSDRTVLRIPARAAFGTGSHESTRLVLELLEGMDLAGRRVLDVGCGTGILSLAALAFGAGCAVAFDLDPAAPFHAAVNAGLNAAATGGARPLLFTGGLAALCAAAPALRFDVALVNVIPEEILPEIAGLAPLLAPGGTAVFSGILASSGERVAAELAAAGFERTGAREAGEWVALTTRSRATEAGPSPDALRAPGA